MGLCGVGREIAMSMSAMPTIRPLIAAALALGLTVSLASCQKKPVESAKAQARAVSVVAVEPREIEGGLVASGQLVPRVDVAIFPQLTGYRVAKVLVDVGAWVKAGQPLAQLDDTLLRAQLAQQTALAAQQADLVAESEKTNGDIAAR